MRSLSNKWSRLVKASEIAGTRLVAMETVNIVGMVTSTEAIPDNWPKRAMACAWV